VGHGKTMRLGATGQGTTNGAIEAMAITRIDREGKRCRMARGTAGEMAGEPPAQSPLDAIVLAETKEAGTTSNGVPQLHQLLLLLLLWLIQGGHCHKEVMRDPYQDPPHHGRCRLGRHGMPTTLCRPVTETRAATGTMVDAMVDVMVDAM